MRTRDAAGVAIATYTRTSSGSNATRGSSHVLYADSILRAPKAIQAIQVTVQASSSYEGMTGKYTYSCTETNEASSTVTLHTFGLVPFPALCTVGYPQR